MTMQMYRDRARRLAQLAATAVLALTLGACATVEPPAAPAPEPVVAPTPAPTFTPITFASGTVDLDTTARSSLRRIATILRSARWANMPVEVAGHSDQRGGEQANLALSEQRAEAVATELEFNGIDRERMVVRALGESLPSVPEVKLDGSYDAEAARTNRRVEIELLDVS